jgi:hypothetical protein
MKVRGDSATQNGESEKCIISFSPKSGNTRNILQLCREETQKHRISDLMQGACAISVVLNAQTAELSPLSQTVC